MLACFAAGSPSRNLLEHLLRNTDAKQRVRAPASGLWSLLEMRLTFSQGALLGPKDESGKKKARRCSTNTALRISLAPGTSCVIQCSDAAGEAPVFTC